MLIYLKLLRYIIIVCKILNNNDLNDVKFYSMKNANDYRDTEISIGFGLFEQFAYIMFNIYWISLEFRITNVSFSSRFKYGTNDWSKYI